MDSRSVSSRQARIVIVTASSDLRQFICRCLRNAGCEVVEATDARSGIETVASMESTNVIFLEWNMPLKNGRDFLAIRDRCPNLLLIPVVAIVGPTVEKIDSPNVCSILKPLDEKILLEIAAAAGGKNLDSCDSAATCESKLDSLDNG